MKAAEKTVVSIHYTLKDDAGHEIDSSQGKKPLKFLFGVGMIIPGLENELAGKVPGDTFDIKVAPAEGYGESRDELIQKVKRDDLSHIEDLKVGSALQAQMDDGQTINMVVTEVSDENVTLDSNHPLAGQTLHFTGEVVEVREATQEELDHKHSH